jgi:hypothetical protein
MGNTAGDRGRETGTTIVMRSWQRRAGAGGFALPCHAMRNIGATATRIAPVDGCGENRRTAAAYREQMNQQP